MKLKDLYSGLRPFSYDKEIIPTVKRSKYFDANEEDLSKAKKIQLLETSKQRTYLISTGKRVYKVLDDRRSERPKITWSRKIEKVFEGRKLKATLEPSSERCYNLVFDASPDRRNLVSKKLFANIGFEDAVATLMMDDA